MLGTSGNTGERVGSVTASALSLPALMYSTSVAMASHITCARPAMRWVSAGAAPRYGTWSMSTPAIILNNSPANCGVVPLPTDAMLILPGLALAYAMNSGTVLAGTEGCTTITMGTSVTPQTGAMSRTRLKSRLV